MPLSLYIHIPFCQKKCIYCDFYSIRYQDNIASNYIDILCKQISALGEDFSTIYVGGGTPTVLEIRLLEKLLKSLGRISRKTEEFTIEANPESLDRDKVKLFLEQGVNRISIGVQSIYGGKLKNLSRIHSAKQAFGAVSLAKNNGFKNISIDFIFGVWGETLVDWKKELKIAVNLPVTHLSVYSLTYEKGTLLYKKIMRNLIKPLDDETSAEMYAYALDYLPKKGFSHYEVSNFAKRGYQCKHNWVYWENKPHIGLGPSAVSYKEGVREKNTANISQYIQKVKNNQSPVVFRESLSPLRRAKETASLKIRTKEGIKFSWFKEKTGFDFLSLESKAINGLISDSLIEYIKNKK
jgi:oxygen-independent coproporphyrinogen-3 oxidase